MSISIERLRSLLDRLSPDHHLLPAVEQAYGIKKSGMNGEASLDYHLHFIDGDFQVLNGIRLQGDLYIFQMDVVLVTRSRIFLIEVKNYAGELIYDEDNHQMLQIVDGQQKAYADPILQAKRQTVQLRKWISQQTLPSIPISSLVVFTNSYASLDSPHPDVIKSSYLPFKINAMKPLPDVWTEEERNRFVRKCRSLHQPEDGDVLERFGIREDELIRGVLCLNCPRVCMDRVHGGWRCPKCGVFSKRKALSKSLQDYALLFEQRVTNKELRNWLDVDRQMVKRIVKQQGLMKSGKTSGAFYTLNR